MQPDLSIEAIPVGDLVAYAHNARTHSDAQVKQIAASIAEFGFVNPVLVDAAGILIAGHGRVLAALHLGLATVPTLRLGHLTDTQVRALRIADNQIALNSGWDAKMLAAELQSLSDLGFDTLLTGFSADELSAIAARQNPGLTDPDQVPDAPVDPISVAGDVWILGRHRIACGDCTNPETVAAALGGAKPHLMVTDPPYGVNYDPAWRERAGVNTAGAATGTVLNDDNADWRKAWALFPGAVAYVWHAGLFAGTVQDSLTACGFEMRSQIVWAKSQMVMSRGDYHWQHEPCWYAVRKGKPGAYAGGRKQTTLWAIDKPQRSETGHSTQKPVECMRRPIENNSKPGQAVYEPFSGSGTTIIAAEMTGRSCHAIELNPAYVDVAVRRWQEFTGEVATLEGDGRSFAEVAAARGGRVAA